MTRHFQPFDFMSENPSNIEQKRKDFKSYLKEKGNFNNLPENMLLLLLRSGFYSKCIDLTLCSRILILL